MPKKHTGPHFRRNCPGCGRPIAQPVIEQVASKNGNSEVHDQGTPVSAGPLSLMRLIKIEEVVLRTGLSRSTVYAKMQRGNPAFDAGFPARLKIPRSRAVRFRETDVEKWIASLTPPSSEGVE